MKSAVTQRTLKDGTIAEYVDGRRVLTTMSDGVRILRPSFKATNFTTLEIRRAIAQARAKRAYK